MSHRGWVVSALTAAAIVVPQQLARESREPSESSRSAWWDSMFAEEGDPLFSRDPALFSESLASAPTLAGSPDVPSGLAARPAMPQLSLGEIFRFDITPESVLQHWPQVWTRFGEDALSGLRVTLMSGTRPTDLTGSLTYYFDQKHVLQRITFSGSCGDPSDLILNLQQSFPLQPVPALGGYQYLMRGDDGQPVSGLQIRYAPVIQQNQPYRRLELELELNRPQGGGSLSSRFRESCGLSPPPDDPPADDPGRAISVPDQPPAADPANATPSSPAPTGPRRRPADELLPHSR